MYGSSFCIRTRRPRRSSSRPMDADVSPFPSELTTPPVTKICLLISRESFSAKRARKRKAHGIFSVGLACLSSGLDHTAALSRSPESEFRRLFVEVRVFWSVKLSAGFDTTFHQENVMTD